MSEIILKQAEADAFIKLEKHDDSKGCHLQLPDLGGKLSVPLLCINKREAFNLDITRGRIDLLKETKQLRSRQVIVLLRLDLGGAPHRNPDDEEIPSPHLHIYREGYGDKWAIPVPVEAFKNLANRWQTLLDFMIYCNITQTPNFQPGIFT